MVVRNTDILSRILQPAELPQEMARRVLQWQFTQDDRLRLEELLDRNNANTLAPEEQHELQTYMVLGDMLNILHFQARLSLGAADPPVQNR
ncbi:MAG TPA: hypothetical protein VHQ47_19870 [Phycisphaerae bacterium]|jgi:hypothetical protein|nr:hypothetical protein [Phycisphaerae bacterium]HWC00651.1 hypothetical protein [Bryobacteraceae bacterium]